MSSIHEELVSLSEQFENCRNILIALGDENRQNIILKILEMERLDGVRVGEITERTTLSRPAVSHHLRILKDAGIVKIRRKGTMNYYYFDADQAALQNMLDTISHARKLMDPANWKDGVWYGK